MAEFINTLDTLGDEAVFDSIIKRTITEFKDDRIKTVRDYAFSNCVNLTKLDIPSATTVKYNSFISCSSLSSINIPSVTRIDSYNAFSNCKALKELVLPSCTYIGHGSFSYCERLEMVDCATTDDLYIGPSAFGSANALKTLVIRSGSVATLDNKNALLGTDIYYSRGYVYIPSALVESYKSDTNWSNYASRFRALEDWTVDGTVTGELNIEGRYMVRFFDEDGTLLYYTIVNSGEDAVFVGDEPTKEGEWAFKGWSEDVTNVTTDIDCYAQFKSTAVVSRKIVERTISGAYTNNRVESVGVQAFSGCSNLVTVDLPSVTSIGASAFYNCSSLATLILRKADTICALGNAAPFNGTPIKSGNGYIYVPRALLSDDDATKDYRRATNWSNFSTKFRAIEDYPEICGGEN